MSKEEPGKPAAYNSELLSMNHVLLSCIVAEFWATFFPGSVVWILAAHHPALIL